MQGRVFAFLAFVAVALAGQSFSVYPLVDNVLYSSSLGVQPNSDEGYDVDLFSFYVPENATGVNITFSNLDNTACDYISLFVKQGGLPCSQDQYSEGNYRCGQGYDLGDGISSQYGNIFVPGNADYLFEYQVSAYWYIAIGRYYSSDYASVCPYNVIITVNQTCNTGSVGLSSNLDSSDSSMCSAAYTTVSTFPSSFSVVALEDTYPVFKYTVPANTGNFVFQVNATSSDLYIYGKSYGTPSDYSYNCYEGSYTNVGTYYIYNIVCTTPRAGTFWIVLENNYEAYNATVIFAAAPTVCANGTGGWNCSFSNVPYAGLATSITLPWSSTAVYLTEAFYYFYLDIPANYSSNPISVTANSADSVTFFYRRDGFPEYDSDSGYESTYEYYSAPHTYNLNQFDYYTAGRIYFAVSCDTSPSCAITFSLNGTLTSTSATSISSLSSTTTSASSLSTTTTTTTASTTTSRTTTTTSGSSTVSTSTTSGAESSSASVIIPSAVFAVVAAALALF